MTKTRMWSGGAALIGVLLLVAAWFLLIAPQRSEAAQVREQIVSQERTNEQVRLQTQQLRAQFASLPSRQAQLAEIKQQMPENPALPSLVRDLSSHAGSAGVTLVSVAPTAPTPLGTSAGTGAGAATTDTAALQQIQTTIVVDGSYAELTLYLQKLQTKMRRALLVENLQLAKAVGATTTTTGDLELTLATKVFVLDTTALAAAPAAANATTVPGAGAAASTPGPSTPGPSTPGTTNPSNGSAS